MLERGPQGEWALAWVLPPTTCHNRTSESYSLPFPPFDTQLSLASPWGLKGQTPTPTGLKSTSHPGPEAGREFWGPEG